MSRTRRRKAYFSVPSWFKRMNRREERAKQKQALREGKDIPIFKKRDAYDYW